MDNKTWLKLVLFFLGLALIAFTIYAVRSLPDIYSDERGNRRQNDIFNKLFRSKRSGVDDCLWVMTATEGPRTLTSPNYPDSYPSNVDCLWLITTRDGENASISIKIDTLAIESEKECRLDYLQVYLGSSALSPSLGPFCGHLKDRVVRTNSSTLLLVFHSDVAYEEAGFSIDYYTTRSSDSVAECRELLTDGSGSLTSPRFPDNYPDDVDCTTLIRVDPSKKIQLIFDSVDLEYGDNCTFDYVQIFDGHVGNSTLLGQVCQLTETRSFESSSNILLVHFHSDDSVNRKGYRARYSSVDERNSAVGNCLWESSGLRGNGTVASPNYPENYPSFANCSLWILAPAGLRVRIHFDSLLLEMESNCSYDFLEIREGPASGGEVLGRFCGRGSEPGRLESSGHEVQIRFQSDDFVEFLGFKLRYEFFKAEAEEKIADENEDYAEEEERFKFSVKPRNATLKAGSSHTLHCNSDHPNAKIRWLKGDFFLAGENPLPSLKVLPNNTLWIQSMGPHLVGLYSCVAVSPEGVLTATANIQLESKEDEPPCKLEFRKTPSDSDFEEGAFAHLECLSAIPEALMSWTKDGSPLRPTDYVTVLKNGYVFMDRVRAEDAGLYTCIAQDPETGCTRRTSARLRVSERTRIEDVCGKPKIEEPATVLQKENGKILGGYDAKKGAYPWQVMLWEPKRQTFCGGTLLNERWIATAAHCLVNHHNIRWETIRIKLGKHDRERPEEQELETSISDSSAVVLHPGFNRFTYDNDLALIRMRDRIPFTDYILPVCLGDRSLSESLLNENGLDKKPKMGTVIGWGRLKEKGPSPRFLQEIKLPVVNPAVCKGSTTLTVTRNMFCAGYAQEVIGDTCQGDSGGPFMMKHEETWYMVGVVSWGEGCGRVNKYGFYTRIANHLSWMQGIMKS